MGWLCLIDVINGKGTPAVGCVILTSATLWGFDKARFCTKAAVNQSMYKILAMEQVFILIWMHTVKRIAFFDDVQSVRGRGC